ncbi:MAG: xylulokinase [Pseudomonadales bacterium]|nr:xylulokinase [Pseudomonadales bacterium]NRA13913.1 xylulokinase [Oceanospirillaceae bacterium]
MFVGIDCGTQSTKVVIFEVTSGQVIGRGQALHDLISGHDGRREQDPSWWIHALTQAMYTALQTANVDASAIKGIGVSGQQHGLVVLDKEDRVIRAAKLWCDTSTHCENEALIDKLGGDDRVFELIGTKLKTGYTASKLLWMKNNEPENYAKIHSILLPHDYINFWLSGEKTTEAGDASGTGYFDIKSKCWSTEILCAIDHEMPLIDKLPPIIDAHQGAGTLCTRSAQLLGLKPGIIIASGGGDNMMGAIGTGNVAQGVITISLGTSGTVAATSEIFLGDKSGEIASFCDSTNRWLPLICTMNLTNVTASVQKLMNVSHSELDELLANTSIGAGGLMMLPFFNGERTPDLPQAKGSLLGIDEQNLNAGNLCRAAVEGVSLGLKYGYHLLQQNGLSAQQIRLIGGGSNSPQWLKMIADMLNVPVVVPAENEAAALGAALQAQWSYQTNNNNHSELADICDNGVKFSKSSITEPNIENVERYQELFNLYQKNKLSLY